MTTRHTRRRLRRTAKTSHRPWWRESANWLTVVVALVLVTTVVFVLERQRPPTVDIDRGVIAAVGVSDSRMDHIEGLFRCPCGNCDHLDLRECDCDAPGGAMEIRTAIARLLDQGLETDEVVHVVARKFGGLRAASAPGLRAPPEEILVGGANAVDQSNGLVASHLGQIDPMDFVAVVSSFDCPCGNCALTLLDCTCDHSRGAVELKSYINTQLVEGVPPDQLVENIEKTYSIQRRAVRADLSASTIGPK